LNRTEHPVDEEKIPRGFSFFLAEK
jgi:hypothetical protein